MFRLRRNMQWDHWNAGKSVEYHCCPGCPWPLCCVVLCGCICIFCPFFWYCLLLKVDVRQRQNLPAVPATHSHFTHAAHGQERRTRRSTPVQDARLQAAQQTSHQLACQGTMSRPRGQLWFPIRRWHQPPLHMASRWRRGSNGAVLSHAQSMQRS